MRKIKIIISAFLLLFVGVFTLASCGGYTGGVSEDDLTITLDSKTSKSITLKVTFNAKNTNLSSGTSKVHIKSYLVDGENETYKADNSVSFGSGITTTQFSSLTPASTYRFRVYVTASGTDYELFTASDKKITYKTTSSTPTEADAVEIKTVEDFTNMKNDSSAYYKLMNDIDFAGVTLAQKFTDSVPFTGVFDGQGFTLKNFVLYSAKYTGLFEYTKGAEIKNVKVDNASIGTASTFSISQSNVGALVGYGYRTIVDNCELNNVKLKVSPSSYSSGKTFVGGVIGCGDTVTITNVKLTDAKVEIYQARGEVATGLFAGVITNAGLKNKIVCDNCFATGELLAYCYYNTSTEGETSVGGFVGKAANYDPIQNSFVNVDIKVTKYVTSSTSYDKFNLYVGGFVGTKPNVSGGGLNVKKSVTVNSIKLYAAQLTGEETEEPDFTDKQMTAGYVSENKEYLTYAGGFLASTGLGQIEGIDTCAAVFKDNTNPIYVNAKKEITEDEETKTLVFEGEFSGYTQVEENLAKCFTSRLDGADFTVFSEAIQDAITSAIAE